MSAPFLDNLRPLLERMALAFPDPRPRERAVEMALGMLCGEMPKTITNALVFNQHQGDWSADYRLFSASKWEPDKFFEPVLEEALRLSDSGPILGVIDDTLLRKTGRQIPGTAYARDPLSPPFHTNLVLGQRFLEVGVLVRANEDKPYRAIPVSFQHTPPLKAPARASQAEKAVVKELAKKQNMSTMGRKLVANLRERIDQFPGAHERQLLIIGDGSFANRTFLRQLPERTTVACRVRKDAKMRRALLPGEARQGNRQYGDHLPTPEALLADPTIPLQTLKLHNGYREVTVQFKLIKEVCWQKVTGQASGTLLLLKPLHYRLRQGDKLLYKQPCYLFIAGDLLDIALILRSCLARWEIEVGFRDQKTILGVGNPQVRNQQSVSKTPAFQSAIYGALLLTSIATLDDTRSAVFPPRQPWQKRPVYRPPVRDLANLVKKQIEDERKHQSSPGTAVS